MATGFMGIHTTDEQVIVQTLKGRGLTSFHCTNGTYAYDAQRIVPTMLAGFQFIDDKVAVPTDAFLIAVNSNTSMQAIMDQKNASQAERDALKDQYARAMKVALPITEQFPQRSVVVVFYDKPTPTDLYKALSDAGMNMESLHKWGYGTDPDAPKIEGAEIFNRVLAYPLVNDVKPVCFGITDKSDQSDIIQVVKLDKTVGLHGTPYISGQGKVLFPVPASLTAHVDKPVQAVAPAPAVPKVS